jgi:hypothetical protein
MAARDPNPDKAMKPFMHGQAQRDPILNTCLGERHRRDPSTLKVRWVIRNRGRGARETCLTRWGRGFVAPVAACHSSNAGKRMDSIPVPACIILCNVKGRLNLHDYAACCRNEDFKSPVDIQSCPTIPAADQLELI